VEANRSLEDMDAYYRPNPPLIATTDQYAVSRKRPQKYIEHEKLVIQKTDAGLNYPLEGIEIHVERLDEETDKN
jgi:hypothetical protein